LKKLEDAPNPKDTVYINASWVHEMSEEEDIKLRRKTYISAQGPIVRVGEKDSRENVDTLGDFWRMVWEYDVELVVMLTRVSEDQKEAEKCTRYWPKVVGTSKRYGLMTVTHENMIREGDQMKYRTFRIEREGEPEPKICRQIQYIGWPDQGVPSHEIDFLNLINKAEEMNSNDRPMVVHCSAGIGRSGTFCAVHSYVKFMRKYYEEKKDLPDINVPLRLIELRQDRPKMVQTREQYEFIYRALYLVFEKLFEEYAKKKKMEVEEPIQE